MEKPPVNSLRNSATVKQARPLLFDLVVARKVGKRVGKMEFLLVEQKVDYLVDWKVGKMVE